MQSFFLEAKKPDFDAIGEDAVRQNLARGKYRAGTRTARDAQAWLDSRERAAVRDERTTTRRYGFWSLVATWASVAISLAALVISAIALHRAG